MKKISIKRHVATKIFFLMLGGYILVTIALTSIYMMNKYNEIKQGAFDNQQMLLTALSPSLGQVTYDGDLDQLESLLQGIMKSRSIAGIEYTDITNTLKVKLGSVPNFDLILDNKNNSNTGLSKINQFEINTLFGLSENIIYNNRVVGTIIISSSQKIIFEQLQSAFLIIVISTLVQGFLLWIFFRWVSTVYLHRRLTDITEGLNDLDIDKGSFIPLKVDTKEKDEIWAIQKSFNEMGKKLQTSHNKLIAYNEELENKVRKRTAQLEKISITDRLTGLYNRHKLDDVLESEFKRAKRFESTFGLIIIDIDFFKDVNDTYGHQVGDKVLIEISNLLESSIRSVDTLGRWGGEEFLIIAPETNLEGVLLLSESIRLKVEKHSFLEVGKKTVSLGVSVYKKGDSIKDLISRTDSALYTSKKKGRNQVQYEN